MEIKLLLVQAISLLYWESQKNSRIHEGSQLVQDLLANFPEYDNMVLDDIEKNNIDKLHTLVQSLLVTLKKGEKVDKTSLLQKVAVSMKGGDKSIYDGIAVAVNHEASGNSEIDNLCLSFSIPIRDYFKSVAFTNEMKKINSLYLYGKNASKYDVFQAAQEIQQRLDTFTKNVPRKDGLPTAIISGANFSKAKELKHLFEDAVEEIEPASILRSGWQGVNLALGGGFRRGDTYVVGGLTGMGKSLFCRDLSIDFCRYNEPFLYDKSKKPMILHITTENTSEQNLRAVYDKLFGERFGHYPPTDIDLDAATQLVMDTTGVNGFEYASYRVEPSATSIFDIQGIVSHFEQEGYEIAVLVLDYMPTLARTGLTVTVVGSDIRDMYRRMRHFCSVRKITFITPHQVSSEAKTNLKRNNTANFLKEVIGKAYWDGCKTLEQEVDVEIVLDQEIQNGQKYLAFAKGKDRGNSKVDPEDKMCYLPIDKFAGLKPDLMGEATYIKSLKQNTGELW